MADEPPFVSIDPDALGDVMARLAALARDLRQQGIATTIDVRIVIAVPADE